MLGGRWSEVKRRAAPGFLQAEKCIGRREISRADAAPQHED
jgi:hypothetical protein